MVAEKGCNDRPDSMIGRILHVSHLLELTILCAFICRVGYSDAQSKETILQVEGLTYLTL